MGILAAQYHWFSQISYKQSIRWFRIALVMLLIAFPLLYYFGGALANGTRAYEGGLTWQSLAYAIIEQFIGLGIIVGLLGVFREKYNFQNKILKVASASAYTVYIIHTFILVVIALLLKQTPLSSSMKFILLAPIVVILCFVLGNFIRKLPYFRQVL